MKDIIAIFLACFIICIIGLSIFGDFIFNNVWFIIIIVSFLLAVLIKVFMNHQIRIEELEKKIELLSHDKED